MPPVLPFVLIAPPPSYIRSLLPHFLRRRCGSTSSPSLGRRDSADENASRRSNTRLKVQQNAEFGSSDMSSNKDRIVSQWTHLDCLEPRQSNNVYALRKEAQKHNGIEFLDTSRGSCEVICSGVISLIWPHSFSLLFPKIGPPSGI